MDKARLGRRECLIGFVSSGLLSSCSTQGIMGDLESLIFDAVGEIENSCQKTSDPRVDICGVALSKSELDGLKVPAIQTGLQWCWAACMQMAFATFGYKVSQARIVTIAYGRLVDLPGHGWQMHRQLNSDWVDDEGRKFTVRSDTLIDAESGRFRNGNPERRVQRELEAGRPVILGLANHAMLIVAQEAEVSSSGRVGAVHRVTVLDPWPLRVDTNQYKNISGSRLAGAQFLATIEVY